MNLYLIIFIIIIIIYLIITKIDGYKLSKYINNLNILFIEQKEYFSTNDSFFQKLRDNYTVIRDEYNNYCKYYKKKIYRSSDIIPINALIDKGDIPWENIILRAFNKDTDLIKYFPKTYNMICDECTFAMFSILPPGKTLLPHHGPFNGILRYHLGLIIPKEKEKCFIIVNNKKYIWEEGKDILFDDTLIHHVENNTDEFRVVLFLDIPRKFNNKFIYYLNKILLYYGKFNTTVDTIVTKVNNLNK